MAAGGRVEPHLSGFLRSSADQRRARRHIDQRRQGLPRQPRAPGHRAQAAARRGYHRRGLAAEVARRYSMPGRAYADFAILRGDPSDGLPGVAGVGPKKAADLIRRYGSLRAMIDAGVFRSADAEYLEKASRVVPPVTDLKIAVPPGRRDSYPEDPKKVEEMGARYGVGGSLKRLSEALGKMPR